MLYLRISHIAHRLLIEQHNAASPSSNTAFFTFYIQRTGIVETNILRSSSKGVSEERGQIETSEEESLYRNCIIINSTTSVSCGMARKHRKKNALIGAICRISGNLVFLHHHGGLNLRPAGQLSVAVCPDLRLSFRDPGISVRFFLLLFHK